MGHGTGSNHLSQLCSELGASTGLKNCKNAETTMGARLITKRAFWVQVSFVSSVRKPQFKELKHCLFSQSKQRNWNGLT